MDFIITDHDIIVEMIAPNVYRIRIKNEILEGLSCPHCGAKLVRNGFYKRIVTNLDTKNKVREKDPY